MTKYSEDIFYTDFHRDIIEELGEVYAWEISYKLAGRKFYIPNNKSIESHPQLSVLSRELAEYLKDRYSGDRVVIPMGSNNDYKQRKIHGISLFKRGETCNDVASKLRVSYSTTKRYRKYAKKKFDSFKQEELF